MEQRKNLGPGASISKFITELTVLPSLFTYRSFLLLIQNYFVRVLQIGAVNGSEEFKLGVTMNADMQGTYLQ